MKYYCNPININYRYQFITDPRNPGGMEVNREAADPSMIYYEGKYYIFASMTLGVWVSEDLVNWENHKLPPELPLYDYAPDVRVLNGYVWYCASNNDKICDRYRTKDILNGPWEKVEGSFPFWDPNLFVDDDGRVYFYWGCSNVTPIYGVELDPETMQPIGEKIALIEGHPDIYGYERVGEDSCLNPASEEEIDAALQAFMKQRGMSLDQVPPHYQAMMRGMFSNMPYIEGAWMDKHCGKYYLQYACTGTQYNTYADGVYVSDKPLGPFTPAENNPYSYKPGGFLPGAGHGSTMQDDQGNWWHTATMRISMNHMFERRVGLWPAGFDKDGELYCNQRYGDWPMTLSGFRQDAFRDPAWMLLSAKKAACASSETEGCEAIHASEENVQTWWKPATASPDEWLMLDLGKLSDVHAIQINFADDHPKIESPEALTNLGTGSRHIDGREYYTRYLLLGSADGENWRVIEDKTAAKTDLSHDFLVREEGLQIRYLKLTKIEVPFGLEPCISGLRVFGFQEGSAPAVPDFSVTRTNDLDMNVSITPQDDALGYNILFGNSEEQLYHSYMVFEAGDKRIGALVKGRSYVVRVDAFNESGITEGICKKIS